MDRATVLQTRLSREQCREALRRGIGVAQEDYQARRWARPGEDGGPVRGFVCGRLFRLSVSSTAGRRRGSTTRLLYGWLGARVTYREMAFWHDPAITAALLLLWLAGTAVNHLSVLKSLAFLAALLAVQFLAGCAETLAHGTDSYELQYRLGEFVREQLDAEVL